MDHIYKVTFVGATTTGKTSLVIRLTRNTFLNNSECTIGASYTKYKHNNIEYDIWDTAGQAQFRPMAPMYYRNAAAAIICYDVTSAHSYKVMTEWLDELHRTIPGECENC